MFPIAEEVYKKIITLPLYPTMSKKDICDVINIVKKIITCYKKVNY
jgi:perosamine synthetase